MFSPTDILTPVVKRRGIWKAANTVVVGDPALIRQILTDTEGRFGKGGTLLGGIGRYIGETSLFTTDDEDIWRHVNTVVRPFFSPKQLGTIAEMITNLWAIEMATWDTGQPVRVYDRYTDFSVTFLLRYVFGFESGHNHTEVKRIVEAAFQVFKEMAWCLPLSLISPPLAARLDTGARKALDDIVYPMISRAKANPGHDLVGRLVAAQSDNPVLTDKVIRDQVSGLLAAGFDSVSAVFSMAVRHLATHPRELAPLKAEVQAALCGRLPTFEDIGRLPSLEAFVVRMTDLHPAFPLFPLGVSKSTVLGGVELRKGTVVVINLHAQAAILDGRGVRHPSRPDQESPYTPFGVGRRQCTARHMSHLMLMLTLGGLVQKCQSLSLPPLARVFKKRYAMTLSAGRGGETRISLARSPAS